MPGQCDPGAGLRELSRRKRIMSLASREALNQLISSAGEVEHCFCKKHAEDWSTCSTTAVLAAAADKLGKLTE